ncbi:MAG: family 16 glycoside hydrolase [Thermoguttaceae bacterium]
MYSKTIITLLLVFLTGLPSSVVFAETVITETVLERIQKLPFTPSGEESPFIGFDKFDGTWTLRDDEILFAAGGSGPKLVLSAPEFKNMKTGSATVEMYFPAKSERTCGMIIKVSDCGIGADSFNGYEIALNAGRDFLLLGAHRQNFNSLKEIPLEVPIGKWFELSVNFTETSFEAFVDGQKIGEFAEQKMSSSDPLRQGSVGLRTWQGDVMYRNFKVSNQNIQFVPKKKTDQINVENGTTDTTDANADDDDDENNSTPDSQFLETLAVKQLPPIAVLLRHPLSPPYAVALDLWMSQPHQYGCEIRIVEPANPQKPERVIFADPDGSIYDMNLSIDASFILFSHKKSSEKCWNIWKINVDGSNLTRLTNDEFFDVSPCEMPSGDIMFVSTRRFGHTVCQPGPASNLFTMKPDGSNVKCVSMNTLSDMSPQLLPDGRMIFTRWEYIDRDLTYRQSLWTQKPDGTGYQLFFGNTVRLVGTFWQARPLPGRTDQVVATFAPHHGFPHGAIGVIDRSYGVESPKDVGYRFITKEFPTIGDQSREWSYRDPFPLTDKTFLCTFGSDGPTIFDSENGTAGPKFRTYLLDSNGEKRLVYENEKFSCFFPTPLVPTPRPILTPDISQAEFSTIGDTTKNEISPEKSAVLLVDVYKGLEPFADLIPRGSVKSIRIMEQIRKTEDLVNRAYDQSPVMGYGTYYAKRNWGTVPVESDGSTYFEVPPLREIYLQILDENGRELHRMTSALQVMPGETISCIGCHENRDTAPPIMHSAATDYLKINQKMPLAAHRSPSKPTLPNWLEKVQNVQTNPKLDAGVIDYPSLVQPVLDEYCVKCHSAEKPEGGYDLSGDKTRFFNMSYDNLLGKSRSYRQHDMASGDLLPDEAAKGKPLVHFYWLLWTPTTVHRPFQSGSFASRLPDYFKPEHCGETIPLEEQERVFLWIDANVPYYGTYAHSRPNAAGRRDRWADPVTGKYSDWFANDFLGVYNNKCHSCHQSIDSTTDWNGRYAWINLSTPEKSKVLTAHLAKDSGGFGIPTSETDSEPLFENKQDADYLKMLKSIQSGSLIMQTVPEADMPGFLNARKEP